jgi:hypothetical protein
VGRRRTRVQDDRVIQLKQMNTDLCRRISSPLKRNYQSKTDWHFIMLVDINPLSSVTSLEDYVMKRYKSSTPQTSIGKISDFEFAVEAFRPGDVPRRPQRTVGFFFLMRLVNYALMVDLWIGHMDIYFGETAIIVSRRYTHSAHLPG